jgi:hypothetical protein
MAQKVDKRLALIRCKWRIKYQILSRVNVENGNRGMKERGMDLHILLQCTPKSKHQGIDLHQLVQYTIIN